MVCLDTDILISFLRGDQEAIDKMSLLRESGEGPLRTTVINAYEMIKGVKQSASRERNELQVRRLISALELLDLDSEACESGAAIFSHLKNHGTMVNELDILIAGIVLGNREKLITRDKGFRRMPELKAEDW